MTNHKDGLVKGDVVLSTVIYGYEYGKIDNGFAPRMQYTYQVDGALLSSATAFSQDNRLNWRNKISASPPQSGHSSKVIPGPIASGDKVIDDVRDDFFQRILEGWPGLQAVEMEGAGAASAIEVSKACSSRRQFGTA